MKCVICQSSFLKSTSEAETGVSVPQLVTTRCGHYFHRICIHSWFEKSDDDSCPLCRQPAWPLKTGSQPTNSSCAVVETSTARQQRQIDVNVGHEKQIRILQDELARVTLENEQLQIFRETRSESAWELERQKLKEEKQVWIKRYIELSELWSREKNAEQRKDMEELKAKGFDHEQRIRRLEALLPTQEQQETGDAAG